MKKVKLPINIYDYKSERKLFFKLIGALFLLSLMSDGYAVSAYDSYLGGFSTFLYLSFIKILLLAPYVYFSNNLYKSYIWLYQVDNIIAIPSIFLIFLIFSKTFDITISFIGFLIFLVFMYLLYIKFKNKKINYKIAAKNLIDKYPEDLILMPYPFFNNAYIEEKKEESEQHSIIINIISHVPIWLIPALAISIAELMLIYMDQNTSIHIFMLLFLFILGCMIVSGKISSDRHKVLFKTAQEMIDEEEERRENIKEGSRQLKRFISKDL